MLAVDLDHGHLAAGLLDPSGSPVGRPSTAALELAGLAAPMRDGRLRLPISKLVGPARPCGCQAIVVEDLDVGQSREEGRERSGRRPAPGKPGGELRRLEAGIPTARVRDRLVQMAEDARSVSEHGDEKGVPRADRRIRIASRAENDMRTPYVQGLGTHDGPKTCVAVREGEALTGVRAGWAPPSRHIMAVGVPTLSRMARKAASTAALSHAAAGPRAVEEPVHARSPHGREPGDPTTARRVDRPPSHASKAEATIRRCTSVGTPTSPLDLRTCRTMPGDRWRRWRRKG